MPDSDRTAYCTINIKKNLNLDTMSGANPVSDYSKIVPNERYFDHLQYIYSQFLIIETKATFGW